MSNFRQVLSGIDVGPLLRQVRAHPELWSRETEWTRKGAGARLAIYETENIVLRYNQSRLPPSLAFLSEDERLGITSEWNDHEWDKPVLDILSEAAGIVRSVMAAIPGDHLGKIVITRLHPGETIPWHVDALPPGWPQYWHRYQIPLQVAQGVRFVVGDEQMSLAPGTVWWFNNQVRHMVSNESTTDRISMLTDVHPAR